MLNQVPKVRKTGKIKTKFSKAVIRWSLNDCAFLLGDKNVEITSLANGESTLVLSNWVTQGTIACYASNAVGQAECKADLSLEKSNLERNYDLLKEEYRIHSGITSRGSYSIVKRASERKSGVEVALKSVCRKSVDKTGIRQARSSYDVFNYMLTFLKVVLV